MTHPPVIDANAITELLQKVTHWADLFTAQEYKLGTNGPEEWFYYFFSEAKYAAVRDGGGKTNLRRAAMAEVMLDLFDVNPEHLKGSAKDVSGAYGVANPFLSKGSDGPVDVKALLARAKRSAPPPKVIADRRVFICKRAFDTLDPDRLREQMCVLLEVGFKKLAADPKLADDPSHCMKEDVERHKRQLLKGYLKVVDREETLICWRGNLADWWTLYKQGGIPRRIENKEEFVKFGLGSRWHPYSDPEYSRHYWFRRSQGDNCYHTALSIGVNSNWKAVAPFPKIGDLRKRPTFIGKVIATCDRPGPDAKTTIELEASVTNLFLFCVDGLVIDTKEVLKGTKSKFEGAPASSVETFPEYGVHGVPFKKVYGWAKVVRVWHSDVDADGFTLFVVPPPHSGPQYDLDSLNIRRFGEATASQLKVVMNSILQQTSPICLKWAATGYSEDAGFVWPSTRGKSDQKAKIVSYRWIQKPENG